jgi:hypothetical protein
MPGTLSPKEKNRNEKVFIRMTLEEIRIVKENAEKYCGGNLSKWMRQRACNPMLDISIKMQDEKDAE